MSIQYVGAEDKTIRLFEGLFPVKNGMRYNSYALVDEKIAVMDSVDEACVGEWLHNIENTVGNKTPDYLIVQHMEPDHSAGISAFAEKYPQSVIVASAKAFVIISQLFGTDFADRRLVVNEGDELCLGAYTLRFIAAPMVHWPEVIVTYEINTQTLFSADAFGTFGTGKRLCKNAWADEARRYYFGIVGKFGKQVQSLLNKLSVLSVQKICPLHGPVLSGDLSTYLELYKKWSSYTPEKKGVAIVYSSVYGNTKTAVFALAERLKARGVAVSLCELTREDVSFAVAQAFAHDRLVIATTTYNGGAFPKTENFLRAIAERNYQNRTVGVIENGSWSPMAAKTVRERLAPLQGISFAPTTVTLRSRLNNESERALECLAEELAKNS